MIINKHKKRKEKEEEKQKEKKKEKKQKKKRRMKRRRMKRRRRMNIMRAPHTTTWPVRPRPPADVWASTRPRRRGRGRRGRTARPH